MLSRHSSIHPWLRCGRQAKQWLKQETLIPLKDTRSHCRYCPEVEKPSPKVVTTPNNEHPYQRKVPHQTVFRCLDGGVFFVHENTTEPSPQERSRRTHESVRESTHKSTHETTQTSSQQDLQTNQAGRVIDNSKCESCTIIDVDDDWDLIHYGINGS